MIGLARRVNGSCSSQQRASPASIHTISQPPTTNALLPPTALGRSQWNDIITSALSGPGVTPCFSTHQRVSQMLDSQSPGAQPHPRTGKRNPREPAWPVLEPCLKRPWKKYGEAEGPGFMGQPFGYCCGARAHRSSPHRRSPAKHDLIDAYHFSNSRGGSAPDPMR